MRARRRLQEAGDARPSRAGERRGADPEQHVRQRRPCSRTSTPTQFATIEPDEVLALAADVEQAAAERERDGEPGEDQRRRLQQRLGEVVRVEVDRVRVPGDVEEPVEARAVPDAAVGESSGLWPVAATTMPPTRNASTAVSTGTTMPAGALRRRPSRDDEGPVAGSSLGGTFAVARRGLGSGSTLMPPCFRPPSISRPISSSPTSPACSPTISSLVHDEDAVGEREHLVELERDEQDRAALVALGDEPPVHVLDRADVEAARRLRRDQHVRVARDLARDDDLLLVAARERAARA